MSDALLWLTAEVLVVPGFEILDAEGKETASLSARVAVQGGYLHVAVPGRDDIQVLSAPALRRVTYRLTSGRRPPLVK